MDASHAAALEGPRRPPRWYAHPYNQGAYYRLASLCARALPRSGRHAVAAAVARLARWRLVAERENVLRNLRRVLSGADGQALEAAATGVFRNFAICLADRLTLGQAPGAALRRYVERVRGEDHLAAAAAPGRGLIVATAHLGNWELGGRVLAAGSGRPTHVVLAAEEDPAVEGLFRRNSDAVRFVTRGSPTASLALLAALRRNEIVAVQGDRATGGRADVRVPFFGAAAAFPLGPFLLARASGAPVLPAFCVLGEDATYQIALEAPIWVGRGGEEAGLRQLVAVIERTVAVHPTQWFTFYDFWGTGGG